MADIKDSVGLDGTNATHDVSLVQLMLIVIKDAKNVPYLAGTYDGAYGPQTKAAIVRFQQDQKLVPLGDVKTPAAPAAGSAKAPDVGAKITVPIFTEKAGLIDKNSLTIKKLNELLPANYKEIIALDKTNLVYLRGAEADAKNVANTIGAKAELNAGFRLKLANVVTQMYTDHKIALSIPDSGWRRDFAWQLKMRLGGKGSHPGESNHQYGQAADVGMNRLEWVAGDGTIAKVDFWLNPWDGKGPKMPQAKRDQLWKARNQIYQQLGLHPTSRPGDDVHIQGYSDSMVDYPRSLANLLTSVGKTKWAAVGHSYKTDFGLGGMLFAVGSATDIWQNKAAVTAADLVAAVKAAGKDLSKQPAFQDFQFVKDAQKAAAKVPAGKGPPRPLIIDGKAMKATDIKALDIAAVQKLLKNDFEEADRNWAKWVVVP